MVTGEGILRKLDYEEDRKIKQLPRRVDTPLDGTRRKLVLSQHASAPLRAVTEGLPHGPRGGLELLGSRRCAISV